MGISPDLTTAIIDIADTIKERFSQPEFIPGCHVVSIADINEYATNNGWVEAICGQHNQQRVRWKSAESVGTASYIDVLYFRDRHLFEAWRIGGGGAIEWPASGITTDTSAFNNNLSAADDTVQKALNTLDNLAVVTDIAATVHAAASKTPPVSADELALIDSEASYGLKKLTWANLLAAIPAGGWPFANVLTVSPTDTDAGYPTIEDAITAAAAGDTILVEGSYSPADTITVNKAVTLTCLDPYGAAISFSVDNKPAIKLTTANAKIVNFNIIQAGAGTTASALEIAANGCVIENTICTANGAATNGYGIFVSAGTGIELRNCQAYDSNGATVSAGLYVASGGAAVVDGGVYTGSTYDIAAPTGSIVTLKNPTLANGKVLGEIGTLTGKALDSKGRDCGALVKNTSGAAVAAGDVGYTDYLGELKTTTTANNFTGGECVITAGGPNNSLVFIKKSGNATINYTGTAPSVGHFLTTSTSAGLAQRSTTMRPEIFAVCLEAGSGGIVTALLLASTQYVPYTTVNRIYAINNHSSTAFVATINGSPSTTSVVYNAPSSGAENNLSNASTSELGKMRLWNTTRNTFRLITACDVATNTITTVASTDAWANGDTLTIASQTTDASADSFTMVEIDLSQQSEIPILARAVDMLLIKRDTGAAGQRLRIHPYEAYDVGKLIIMVTNAASDVLIYMIAPVKLINRVFCYQGVGSGSGTADDFMEVKGYWVAAP